MQALQYLPSTQRGLQKDILNGLDQLHKSSKITVNRGFKQLDSIPAGKTKTAGQPVAASRKVNTQANTAVVRAKARVSRPKGTKPN
jgi:hypothetical protein